jgi:hypothetical protein
MTVADRWHKEAETWFDGSVDSVDRRLAACNTLLHLSRDAVATEGIGPSTRTHLAAIGDLEATQTALRALRHDLLTAASDRRDPEDIYREDAGREGVDFRDLPGGPMSGAEMSMLPRRHYDDHRDPLRKDPLSPAARWALSHRERRYVALESAKFIQANLGIPADELATRARHHAELQTSTFPAERSRRVTAAFVGKVVELHRDLPRPRVASRPVPDLPDVDELMFL